jgi:hypothetical protein
VIDFPFPLGVSQFTTMPWSFEENLRNYAALGSNAIEVCEFKGCCDEYLFRPAVDSHNAAKQQPTYFYSDDLGVAWGAALVNAEVVVALADRSAT